MTIRAIATIVADARARATGVGCIIGVDGPSGSGKSTLARRLSRVARAPVVPIDDFVSWHDFAGWWPRFESEVLTPLAAGCDTRYRVRDWENDEFGATLNGFKDVAWAPLIIVEGVTCTRAAAGAAVTFRVWVEADTDVRLQRGIARDGEEYRNLWLQWMKQEALFFERDGTRQAAGIIVNGDPSVPHDPEREVVLRA